MLEAGLLESHLDAVSHFAEFSGEIRRQLAIHLASVTLYSEKEPGPWAPTVHEPCASSPQGSLDQ